MEYNESIRRNPLFQHFARFMTFTADGNAFKNKLLKDKIEVSVVLDLDLDVGCVDMLNSPKESLNQ
ncbi:hypothetical protein PAECIP111802_07070 [Paenibacillus allorhizosphaerae]|uniref:Uncharacterized protein n=1 Tax=Paenibacillus allorhizosphaerae TaxID=2849866 RepID=A0ABN7TWL4_9BACL|nr:hypothetical protein PAECIP111802_07070 [Paenibacillus allorhizosphaerae]